MGNEYRFGDITLPAWAVEPRTSTRDILKALGVTAYDKESEDGTKWTDAAQFERDVRAVLDDQKERAARKERKAALKRIKALSIGA